MRRTADVALTEAGKTNVNHLRVPEYGVLKLALVAGDKSSKSHLLDTAPPPKAEDKGIDSFCFAPGPQLDETTWKVDKARGDKVKLSYSLDNPCGAVTKATLELFRRWDDKPLWTRELAALELAPGDQELEFDVPGEPGKKVKEWDGAVTKSDEFPDGFVTAEHSPYKLRLKLEGEGNTTSPMAWTYFHVLLHKVELEWGDKEAIENDAKKRKPFEMLKASCPKPADADDTKGRIYLVSHIFKKGGTMFDNSLHDLYSTMWDNGPQIPIYAKVWSRDSKGAAVLAPKALGKTKFLWDWESKLDAPANAFVKDAQDCYKDTTKPKGQNCHEARGGKRAEADAAKGVFPPQTGYDAKETLTEGAFPFEVTANADKRKWASYSTAWRDGKLAAKTGVLFRPSRMAGDKYKVTVYAAHETTDDQKRRLNVDTEPPLKIDPPLKAETGTMRVWRKMYFRRRMMKSGNATVGVAGIKAYFETSFLDIEDKTAAVEEYPSADWNTAFTAVYNGWSDFDKYFVDSTVDQHAAGTHGVEFRTRNQFKTYITTNFALADPIETWMTNQGLATVADYSTKCQNLAIDALCRIFDSKMPADDGISLFHTLFSMQQSLVANMASFTDGLAHDFGSGSVSQCAFLWLAPTNIYPASQGVDATPAHEIGHHLMLPHPKNTGENTGGSANNDYSAHDAAVDNCLMSYKAAARELCGFCQLRLRGWDKSKLSTTSATNKKT